MANGGNWQRFELDRGHTDFSTVIISIAMQMKTKDIQNSDTQHTTEYSKK